MAPVSRDYLDARGAGPNFMTGQPYSDAYKILASDWSKLPVYSDPKKVREILSSLRDHPVTVVISATGSGKSVIVPRLAMRQLVASSQDMSRIAMTFPKSVLASQSAAYASRTWDVPLGGLIGYQFRGAPADSHGDDTRVLFLTDGTLYTMSRKDPLFSRFQLVIIDEAHERSVQTDLLLERLKQALVSRPTFRVIIMSATIDPGVFTRYFEGAAVVMLAGKPTYEIKHHWEPTPVSPDAFLPLALERAGQALDASPSSTDVLVFVPTTKDASKGCRLLQDSKLPVRATTLCEGLYRKLPDALKDVVIHGRPIAPLIRKLVFATPIAESSITLPNLSAVVDSGLQLSSTWLAAEQATRVTRTMTSQAQIAQRVGRVGRVGPGAAYHLYSQAQFRALRDFPEPAILHTDLTEHFLAELCRPGDTTVDLVLERCARLITPPTHDQTESCVNTLSQLGLVEGGLATDMGRSVQDLCDMFKRSLSCALVMLGGMLAGCREDAIILACILEEVRGELTELWALDVIDPRVPLQAHCDGTSDHVSLVRVYREVYLRPPSRSSDKLHLAVWDRVHARIDRDLPRYLKFTHRGRDPHSTPLLPESRSRAAFSVPLVRALGFARRHRQMMMTAGRGVSAGPLKPSIATARPMLALMTSVSVPGCVGALYDELVEVGGTMAFSVLTWIF